MLKDFKNKEREFKIVDFQGKEIKIYTSLPLINENYLLKLVKLLAIQNGVRNPSLEKMGIIIGFVENFVAENVFSEVEDYNFTEKAQIYLDSGLYEKVIETIEEKKYNELLYNIDKYLESEVSLGASLTELLRKIEEITSEGIPNLINTFSTFLNEENMKKIDNTIEILKKLYKE